MDRRFDSNETFAQAMVCVTFDNPVLWQESLAPFSGLWSLIVKTIDSRDLDAHIALLILKWSRVCAEPQLGLLSRRLAGNASFDSNISRSKDVAIMGTQLALGISVPVVEQFDRVARRELARQPLPPAACIKDDERLLIGVSAGIGKACPALSSDLIRILRSRPQPHSVRQQCIDLWAESLCSGENQFSIEISKQIAGLLRASLRNISSINPEDCVPLCWIASRLIESDLSPASYELEEVQAFVEGQARSVYGLVALLGTVTPIDAAFLLGLQNYPLLGTKRKGVSLIVETIDGFGAALSVLSKRQRDRAPFVVEDEYDLQDLFHALVVPRIPDFTSEDPAPKLAGKSSRLDFTSKSCRLGVELKHVRSKRHAEEVREEILVDQGTYFRHPEVDSVVTFVFDPGSFIPAHERSTFEGDLSRAVSISERTVNHIVKVR
jgi:REase_DpnII-MboI